MSAEWRERAIIDAALYAVAFLLGWTIAAAGGSL